MGSRFETYEKTTTGQRLVEAIKASELVPEFHALSAIGKPAVQAIAAPVSRIIEDLPTKAQRAAASQFCGWHVGQTMRRLGYQIARKRGRVADAPFKTGAVWKLTALI